MMGRTCGKAGERNVTRDFGWVGRSAEEAELRVCTLRADKKTENLKRAKALCRASDSTADHLGRSCELGT